MKKQSDINKRAWNYRANEHWIKDLGNPDKVAIDMVNDPNKYLRRHIEFLGDVKDKKIVNILGSCGKKAVPLAVLGADVTVIDISSENRNYAMEVSKNAKVDLTYIVSDFLEVDIKNIKNSFDIAYMEGGILHYFSELNDFSRKVYDMLKVGGKLILNDFHPIRKIFKDRDIFVNNADSLDVVGDYFENDLHEAEVAYEKLMEINCEEQFPKCLLRYWTMGEIITSFAEAGFVIEKLIEGPRFDEHKNIPGEFTLVAHKNEL
ncbi:class I SAM-dependent methyltransferase [Clostridium ihumii]|uniref:class I SAM-dependent methyltransferase n=1 Tax=Clostridium ihumii TaxID=1470356 RepID=UPI00058C9732|nr:methyltransferase domain-containing protein [Clostridium ihumii]